MGAKPPACGITIAGVHLRRTARRPAGRLRPSLATSTIVAFVVTFEMTVGCSRTAPPCRCCVYVGYLMRSRFKLAVRSLVIHWFLLLLA
jgi:hypothetical protein